MIKRWIAIGTALAGAAWAVRKFTNMSRKQPEKPAAYNKGFSIATYNLQAHHATDEIESLANVIRSMNTDVIALQELTEEASAYFDTALRHVYPHMSLHPAPTGEEYNGQAVLSRYPIDSQDFWQETMGNLYVCLNVDNQTLNIMNAHPAAPATEDFEQRSKEIDDVLRYIKDHSGPMILLGDMNMTEWADDYDEVTSQFTDAFAVAEPDERSTFPANLKEIPVISSVLAQSVVRLDYIFFNHSLHCTMAATWSDSGSSDHHPVWAVFEFAD